MRILPIALCWIALPVFSLAGCGASAEGTEISTESTETSAQESRLVIELVLSGMTTQADADEIRDELEGISKVQKVMVDLKAGTAKILMDEGIEMSDAPGSTDLMNALPGRFSFMGLSFDFHRDRSWKKKWSF